MRSTPQSLPTSTESLNLADPFPETRMVATPLVVTRAAVCALRLQITVVPGPNSMRAPLPTLTAPYVPGARSQRAFPGMRSPLLQSWPTFTLTELLGSHAGKGSVTPHAAATSPGSVTQLSSQLGMPLPSRSPRSGPSNGLTQSGSEAGSPIIAQVGKEQSLFANTSKKERVPQTPLAATCPGAGTQAFLAWKRPHRDRRGAGEQLTPRLQAGGSIERLAIRSLVMPSAR